VDAGKARVAEKVHMVVLGIDPRLFFRPVPTPKLTRWCLPSATVMRTGTSVGRSSVLSGSMLANWNSSRPYSRPLGLLQDAALIEIAGLERELALDNAASTVLFPGSQSARCGRSALRGSKGQRRAFSVRPVVLAGLYLRVRIAVILELVESHFAGRHDELASRGWPTLRVSGF